MNDRVPDRRFEPPLHRAARLGDHDTIRRLVAEGADVNERYELGQEWGGRGYSVTPFMVAAGSSDGATADTLRLLFELGADDAGVTSLLAAAGGMLWQLPDPVGGDAARLELLLEYGAEPNAKQSCGPPVLVRAAQTGEVERVQLLLDAGAVLDPPGLDDNILVSAGSVEVLELLLHAGADPFTPTLYSGSVLRAIAQRDELSVATRVEMVRVLQSAGVDVDAPEAGASEWSPLCRVAFESIEPGAGAVEVLLAVGADPFTAEDPLGLAVWSRDYGVSNPDTERKVDLLVAAGCSVDRRDENDYTPLHGALMPYNHGRGYASSDGIHVPGAAALMRHGASIDITFGKGVRPLHIVASEGCPNGIELLLNAGADPRERDDEGKTPLDYVHDSLKRARELPSVEVYRGFKVYANKSDAELRAQVEQMTAYHVDTLIPNAERCLALLKNR